MAGFLNQVTLDQTYDDTVAVNTADSLNLGACDRLVVGNHSQRLISSLRKRWSMAWLVQSLKQILHLGFRTQKILAFNFAQQQPAIGIPGDLLRKRI